MDARAFSAGVVKARGRRRRRRQCTKDQGASLLLFWGKLQVAKEKEERRILSDACQRIAGCLS
jgi:hypothetical protein